MKLIPLQLCTGLPFLVAVGAPLIVAVEQQVEQQGQLLTNPHCWAFQATAANSWIEIPVPAAARQGRKHEKRIAPARVFV